MMSGPIVLTTSTGKLFSVAPSTINILSVSYGVNNAGSDMVAPSADTRDPFLKTIC